MQIDSEGCTPLQLCAVNRNLLGAKILINAGCDINARDHEASTALIQATLRRHYDLQTLLLQVATLHNYISALRF